MHIGMCFCPHYRTFLVVPNRVRQVFLGLSEAGTPRKAESTESGAGASSIGGREKTKRGEKRFNQEAAQRTFAGTAGADRPHTAETCASASGLG